MKPGRGRGRQLCPPARGRFPGKGGLPWVWNEGNHSRDPEGGREPRQKSRPAKGTETADTTCARVTAGPLNFKGYCVRKSLWRLESWDRANWRKCFNQGSAAAESSTGKAETFRSLLTLPHPLGSSRKACQLRRSIFLFLLLGLSLRFCYHDASNRACVFLGSHLPGLAREAGASWRVGQGLRGALLHCLCSQQGGGRMCVQQIRSRKGGGLTECHRGNLLGQESPLKIS